MPTFDEVLQAKQSEVLQEKESASANVQDTKQQLLSPNNASDILGIEPNSEIINNLLELGSEARQVTSDSPIVEQEGNLFKHADGLYSVETAEGKTLSGLDELTARQFVAFNQENARAVAAGAPTSFLGTKASAIGQSIVDIGTQAASAFTTDSSNLKAIKDFGQDLKSNIPVNRKEQVAVRAAFSVIAKNQGNWAAIWNAATNDLDTLISQGIDSTPWMVAFTVGGPITQISILSSLAIGKGNQAVEEFTEVNGRRPTEDETIRIKLWSAVGTVAEKYGDMAALRAIPGRLAWIKQVQKTVKSSTPPSILSLTVFRPGTALAGEALSGGITAATEQLAAEGEITDTGAIAFDALAEAAGVPGGLTTLAIGSGIVRTAEATIQSIKTPDAPQAAPTPQETPEEAVKAREARIASDKPVSVGETPDGLEQVKRIIEIDSIITKSDEAATPELIEERAQLIAELSAPASKEASVAYKDKLKEEINQINEALETRAEEAKTDTKIEDKEFKEVLDTITKEDLVSAAAKIKTLSKRALSETQKTAITETINSLKESVPQEPKKDSSLGSFQKVFDLTPEQVSTITSDPDISSQDKAIVTSAVKANKLEAKLKAAAPLSTKETAEVHNEIVDGVSDRWVGLNTYRKRILDVIENQSDPVLAKTEIKVLTEQMQVHATNLENKLSAFNKALTLPKKDGFVVAVYAERVNPGSADRTLAYSAPKYVKMATYLEDRKSKSVNAINQNSTKLINTLTDEVAFSKEVLKVVEGYTGTSFSKAATKVAAKTAETKKASATLESIEIKKETFEVTPEQIEELTIEKEPAKDANFIEQSATEFPSIITLKGLTETIKTSLTKAGTAVSTSNIAARILKNKEKAVGILGKKFSDLVKFKSEKGIHTLSDEAFVTPGTLKTALADLGINRKSAQILTDAYKTFNTRYQKIAFDNPRENFAINEPLSILHRDGKLPPQVIFSMMLGTLNWIQQNPKNNVFKNNFDRELFLYGGQTNLSTDETGQLEELGYGYQAAANSIGTNIASMMKMSAESTDTSIYFDNLTTALGLAALQIEHGVDDKTALFEIKTHTWDFQIPTVENRIFNNAVGEGATYKHIRLNEDLAIGEEGTAALKDISNIIKVDIDVDANIPNQEPSNEVIKSIRNSFGGVPKKVASVIKKLQNTPWTTSETMDTVTKLAVSHRSVLNTIAGVETFDAADHESVQVSLTSSNSDKLNALDDILEAHEKKQLDKFYFKYGLQNQHRILMQGNINPQQSKISRYLLRSFKAITYTDKNIDLFKLAVTSNIGFDVDKNTAEAAIVQFDALQASENIFDAVEAIKSDDMNALAKLLPSIQDEFGGNISILNGLTALAKYTPDTAFESDVVLEIDGISNGFAMNVLQFPIFDDVEKALNQTGTYYGNTAEETAHDTDAPDSYESLGALVKESSTIEEARDYATKLKRSFNSTLYTQQSNALSSLYPTLIDGDLRTLVKYPFLIFMYGGGIKSISEGVAKEITADLYDQLNKMQKAYLALPIGSAREIYLESTVVPFTQHLNTLGAFSKTQKSKEQKFTSAGEFIRHIKTGTTKSKYFADANLIPSIGELIAPRLDTGLNTMLGGTDGPRKAVIQAGEILHAVFMAHYDKAVAAKLATLGSRVSLTKKETDKIITEELITLLPQYRGPLSQLSNTDNSFVDLTTRETTNVKSGVEVVEFLYTKNDGKKGTVSSSPRQTNFAAPGVSALIRMIINMDSSLLTLTLDQHPDTLMLHDAFMGNPEQLNKISDIYGKLYLELGEKHSVIDSVLEQINTVLADTDRKDKANGNTALRDAANKWILDNAFINKQADNPQNLETLLNGIKQSNQEVIDARDSLKTNSSERGGIVSHQMYIPRPVGEPTFRSEMEREVQNTINFRDLPADPDLVDSTEQEKIIEDAANETLGSLNDLPRSNPVDKLIGDITENNVNTLFRKMKEFSSDYYSTAAQENQHTAVLDTVLQKLAKGMTATTQIHLNVEQINGITQGVYDPIIDRIRLSLSRQPPVSVNGQSPQEVYVHEMLHAVTFTALHNNSLIARQAERLYQQVKNDLDAGDGYRVFLRDIAGSPSTADIEKAKEQYKYIFNNPTNEVNRLDEFLAYAVTNRAMIGYLSSTTPKRKVFLNKLLELVDIVIEAFNRMLGASITGRKGTNTYQEMLGIVDQLVAIQSKHESQFQKLASKTYKHLDKSDQKIREFASKTSLKFITTGATSTFRKVVNVVAGVPAILISENAAAARVRDTVHTALNKTLRSIASEIGGGILSKEMIEQLLHAKVNVSKARREAERVTTDWFNTIWKSVDPKNRHSMSVETKEALTNVMLRTDLSSLKNNSIKFSEQTIANLIGNKAGIETQQKSIQRRLKLKSGHAALLYANELGEFIITGRTHLHAPHMNVNTIAQQYLTNVTPETLELLDAYATLSALNNIDSRQAQLVKGLARNEFATSPTENGFIDMLDRHIVFKDKSRRTLFKGNPTQMVKGFIVERVDNLTSLRTGTAAETEQMRKAGFTEAYQMGKIPGIAQTHDTLFVARNTPEVADASGIMSTTNQRNMGTTLSEIFAKDPAYTDITGKVNFKKINRDVQKAIRREALGSKTLKRNNSLKLRPIRNDRGSITDYRVMMDNATKKELLRPDMEVQNVFAHMESLYVDRKNTIISDKKTVEILVHEQADMQVSNPELFIDFLDPNSEYIDRYRKLPREVRKYIGRFAINGKFMVREDVIDKVFGFRVFDLSQLKVLQLDSLAGAKRYAGLIHYFIREVVGYGKDRIVIAMPQVVFGNMFSNVYQLLMRKIPLSFLVSKLVEGFFEYQRYKEDTEKRTVLKNLIAAKKLPATNPIAIRQAGELIALNTRIENNRIHQMSAAGLNSLIVEDINEAQVDGYFNRIRKSVKSTKLLDKVPTNVSSKVSTIASYMFMSKSSKPYQLSRTIVQLTDFLGRYVMIEHATKVKGQDFKSAMHDAINAFVLFDETLTPAMEALDAVGMTSFLSYYLRNQRASRKLVVANPTGVGLAAAVQYATGIPTLGNINSSIFGLDMSPNLMQLDDLFDEATNVTGANLLINAFKKIFN